MQSNFVNVIGYQLEKVHTGVIRWLLDSMNPTVPIDEKYEIIRRTYRMSHQSSKLDFTQDHISSITCTPEYSIGRKRKIDLVIQINLINRPPKYFVIEMKVDSIADEAQLWGTRNDFFQQKYCSTDDVMFFLYLLGTSQVCKKPDNLHDFIVFELPEIIEVYSGLHINEYLYMDWIDELKNEFFRKTCILQDLKQAEGMSDNKYWKENGFRGWQPYYYIYNYMKQYSTKHEKWVIYSGGNNPVMNFWGDNRDGWIKKNIFGYPVEIYWEFNNQDFLLKVKLSDQNKLPQDEYIWLRNEISNLCKGVGNGKQTRITYGTHNSIFKWDFDFKKQDLTQIMATVDNILDTLHPKIKNL